LFKLILIVSNRAGLLCLNAAGVPCGLVQNVAQALDDPEVRQQMVIEVERATDARCRGQCAAMGGSAAARQQQRDSNEAATGDCMDASHPPHK